MTLFEASFGEWTIWSTVGALPEIYADHAAHASLVDEFDLESAEGCASFVSVGRGQAGWPELVVAQRFAPGPESGFHPGALIAPEAATLFVGAGTRLLAYDLTGPRRLWEDIAEVGFWSWRQHGAVVLMAAELELAAWDGNGRKLWSHPVEPPWDYAVAGTELRLEVMGLESRFPLAGGPAGA